jgi:HAD superfamily hydrolase (TIGR01509 family)
MIELVIFDCDGVLVDTEPIACRVTAQVLTGLGWPLSEADVIERFVGRSRASIGVDMQAHLGEQRFIEADRQIQQLYWEAVDAELAPIDGIVDVLAELTLSRCVASSGTQDKMRKTLGRTGLYPFFEGRIFSATEVEHGKPAPDLFLHAAKQLGVRPERCVVVEDSRPGVQAARAAGMRSFGYAGGVTPAEWLVGPDTVVFHDMRELPKLLAAAR